MNEYAVGKSKDGSKRQRLDKRGNAPEPVARALLALGGSSLASGSPEPTNSPNPAQSVIDGPDSNAPDVVVNTESNGFYGEAGVEDAVLRYVGNTLSHKSTNANADEPSKDNSHWTRYLSDDIAEHHSSAPHAIASAMAYDGSTPLFGSSSRLRDLKSTRADTALGHLDVGPRLEDLIQEPPPIPVNSVNTVNPVNSIRNDGQTVDNTNQLREQVNRLSSGQLLSIGGELNGDSVAPVRNLQQLNSGAISSSIPGSIRHDVQRRQDGIDINHFNHNVTLNSLLAPPHHHSHIHPHPREISSELGIGVAGATVGVPHIQSRDSVSSCVNPELAGKERPEGHWINADGTVRAADGSTTTSRISAINENNRSITAMASNEVIANCGANKASGIGEVDAANPANPSGSANANATSANGGFDKLEIERLDRFMQRYCDLHRLNRRQLCQRVWSRDRTKDSFWEAAAAVLPHRTRASVYKHVRRAYHVFPERGKWDESEDQQLSDLVKEKGAQWREIGIIIHRMPEDCRDRWRNYVKCGGRRNQNKWIEKEESLLKEIIGEMTRENPDKPINWTIVSERMGGTRSRIQCRYKWRKLSKQQNDRTINDTSDKDDGVAPGMLGSVVKRESLATSIARASV